MLNKKLFVSPANSSLGGILKTIGDITDIFGIVKICLSLTCTLQAYLISIPRESDAFMGPNFDVKVP